MRQLNSLNDFMFALADAPGTTWKGKIEALINDGTISAEEAQSYRTFADQMTELTANLPRFPVTA